jgi:sugar-specific transcriptional regulator TrmB
VYLESLGNISGDPMKYLAVGGDSYLTKFQTDFKNSITDFGKYFTNLGVFKK